MKKILLANLFIAFSISNLFSQPSISMWSPTYGPAGTNVHIDGHDFALNNTDNAVYFGATRATVIGSSSTSIVVVVPNGANSQFISVTHLGQNLTAYTTRPYVLTFTCGTGINSTSFSSSNDYTTDYGPKSTAAGDFDNDGLPDLVTANFGGNTISILKNTSSGSISFASQMSLSTGIASNPNSVTTGDLDGDGKLDIAVANNNAGNVTIFRNTSTTGSISFASVQTFAAGTWANSLAIRDLDMDGKPDLAIAAGGLDQVIVLKNTSTVGNISFASGVGFTTGSNPIYLAIDDIDGVLPDIIVANSGSNTFSVLRNTSSVGSISFATKVDFTCGDFARCISINDFDSDNKLDVAVSSVTDNIISVFRNTSTSGNVSFAPKVDYPTASGLYYIRSDDMDGDGKPDLLAAITTTSVISIFKNNSSLGSISFVSAVDFATGFQPSEMFTGDLNNDGKPDIAHGNGGTSSLSVLTNTQCVTDISETEANELCAIYPNPVKDFLFVEKLDDSNQGTVQIIDGYGKIVFEKINYTDKSINVSDLSNGVYFFRYFNGENNYYKTFVVIH